MVSSKTLSTGALPPEPGPAPEPGPWNNSSAWNEYGYQIGPLNRLRHLKGSIWAGPQAGGGGGYPTYSPVNMPEDKGAKYMGIAAMISATFAGIAQLAQLGIMANQTSPPVYNSYNSYNSYSEQNSCNTSSSCGGYSSCGSYC